MGRTKKLLLTLLCIAFAMATCLGISAFAFAEVERIEIGSYEQLKEFADNVNGGDTYEGKTVVLTASVEIPERETWTPIGNGNRSDASTPRFKGVFDGGNFTVSGINSENNLDDYSAGFFGIIENAAVNNLKVDGGAVSNDIDSAGAIAGVMLGKSVISGCENLGVEVTAGSAAGGIVGRAYGTDNTVENCINRAVVTGVKKVGGIVGITNNKSLIATCENYGTVTGNANDGLGGIAGYVNAGTEIKGCKNFAAAGSENSRYSGGIAGYVTGDKAVITASSNDAAATITAKVAAGGIVGIATTVTDISDSANAGAVISAGEAGGIVGRWAGGVGNNCENSAAVKGGTYAGGVAGRIHNATVKNCKGGAMAVTVAENGFAGRIFGAVWNTAGTGGASLYIDDDNGDDYYSLGTIGILAPGTNWGVIHVEQGTMIGEPEIGNNTAQVYLSYLATWGDKVAGIYTKGPDSADWTVKAAVAGVNGVNYDSLADALAAADNGDTVELLSDVTITEGYDNNYALVIPAKSITLEGNGKTITAQCGMRAALLLQSAGDLQEVTLQNLTIKSEVTNRYASAIEVWNGNVTLNLNKVTLIAEKAPNSSGISLGGNGDNLTVNIKESSITASNTGYAFSTFNPVVLDVSGNSTLKGWAALYLRKAGTGKNISLGSYGSKITVNGSHLYGESVQRGGGSNDFGLIVLEDGGVTLDITDTEMIVKGRQESDANIQSLVMLSNVGKPLENISINIGGSSSITLDGAKSGYMTISGATEDVNWETIAAKRPIQISGGTMNKLPDFRFFADGCAITESDGKFTAGTVEELGVVAEIEETRMSYVTLQEAVNAAKDGENIKLLDNVVIDGDNAYSSSVGIRIENKSITIDGEGKYSVSTQSQLKLFEVYGSGDNENPCAVTFKNINLVNTAAIKNARVVDTRGGNIVLNLEETVLDMKKSAGVNVQPLTIGGNSAGMSDPVVNVTGGGIHANGSGYAIIVFNPVKLTVNGAELSGWSALYFKGENSSVGSRGSDVTITGGTVTVGANQYDGGDNDFGVITFEDGGIKLTMDGTEISSIAEGVSVQAIFLFSSYIEEGAAPSTVTVANTDMKLSGDAAKFVLKNTSAEIADDVTVESGSSNFPIESEYLADGVVLAKNAENDYVTADENSVAADGFAATVKGDTYIAYKSLAEAVGAADKGDTVTLLGNVTIDETISISKGITLDLGRYTITSVIEEPDPTQTNAAIYFNGRNKFTVKNGKLVTKGTAIDLQGTGLQGVATITLSEDLTIESEGVGIYAHGGLKLITSANITARSAAIMTHGSESGITNIDVTGGAVTSTNSIAMYLPQKSGTINIKGGTVKGTTGIELRNGTLNITGGTVIATGTELSTSENGSGSSVNAGAAVAVSKYAGTNSLKLNVGGGKLQGLYAVYEENLNPGGAEIDVSKITVSLTDGTYEGKIGSQNVSGFISGGDFDTDVSDYLASGSSIVVDENGSKVNKGVAKIAETDEIYDSLQEAVNAAGEGQTIVLLGNAKGDGVVVSEGSNFTLNLAGFTYTVDGETVGSAGTETNGFQLLKDSVLTFKNGTIESTKAAILIQNYSDLTLDNVVLKLENPNKNTYTLSNNNGDTVLKSGTQVINNGTNGVAFDVCYYSSYPSVSVTVESGVIVTGRVEVTNYKNALDFVDNVKLTVDPSVEITLSEGLIRNGNEIIAAAARIGDTYYATLKDAVNSVTDSTETTIELLYSTDGAGIIVPENRNIIFDFGGNTYRAVEDFAGSGEKYATQAFQLLQKSNITFKNGTVTIISDPSARMVVQNYSNLTLENITIDGTADYVSYALSNNNGDTVIGSGTKIIAREGAFAFDVYYFANYPSVRVTVEEGATVIGKVTMGSDLGKPNFAENATLYVASGVELDLTDNLVLDEKTGRVFVKAVELNGVYYATVGEAFANIPSSTSGTNRHVKLLTDIYGDVEIVLPRTLTSYLILNGYKIVGNVRVDASVNATLAIGSGSKDVQGEITGDITVCNKAKLNLRAGYFGGSFISENGGTVPTHFAYTSLHFKNIEGYTLNDGLIFTEQDPETGYYSVVEDQQAKIGDVIYPTVQKAVNAAVDGDVIVLLKNVTCSSSFVVDASVTIDLNGFTLTSSNATVGMMKLGKDGEEKTITIRNGTIIGTAANENCAAMQIIGTTTLILDGVTVKGENYGIFVGLGSTAAATIRAGEKGFTVEGGLSGIRVSPNGTDKAASLVLEGGKVVGNGMAGIDVIGTCGDDGAVIAKAELTVKDSVVEGNYYGIGGNGNVQAGGTVITVSGGEIIGHEGAGIYNPQVGEIYIEGGTVKGLSAIEMRAGSLNMSGGTLIATAEEFDKIDDGDNNGSVTQGAGVAVINDLGKNIVVNISEGNIQAADSVYVFSDETGAGENEVVVSGGSLTSDERDYLAPDCMQLVSEGIFTVGKEEQFTEAVAAIEGTRNLYLSLQEAVNAAGIGKKVVLRKDVYESIVIGADKEIILDLNNFTLSNTAGSSTITNNGVLTVIDSGENGTVTNVSEDIASVYNAGTAYLNGGTFTRTVDGTWYVIENEGEMELRDVTVKNLNKDDPSSLVQNNLSADSVSPAHLTIYSGVYDCAGGNVIMNNDYGYLIIENGTFGASNFTDIHNYQAVQNYGTAVINGGTFNANAVAVAASAYDGQTSSTTINGGTFTAGTDGTAAALYVYDHDGNSSVNVTINSGKFEGPYAIKIYRPDNTTGESMQIKGGTFIGNIDMGDMAGFISGGEFSLQPAEDYMDPDYIAAYRDGWFVPVESSALRAAQANAQADVRQYAATLGIFWTDIENGEANAEAANHTAAALVMKFYNAIAQTTSEKGVAEARLAAMDAVDAYAAFITDIEALDTAKANAQAEVLSYAAASGIVWADIESLAKEETLVGWAADAVLEEYAKIAAANSENAVANAALDAMEAIDMLYKAIEDDAQTAAEAWAKAKADKITELETWRDENADGVIIPMYIYTAMNGAADQAQLDAYFEQAKAEISDIAAYRAEISGQTDALTNLAATLKTLQDAMGSEFDQLIIDIKDVVSDAQTAIVGGDSSESLASIRDYLEDIIKTTLDSLRSELVGEDGAGGVLGGLAQKVDGLKTTIDGLGIASEFDEVLEAIVKAQNSIDGNTEAISSAVGELQSSISNAQQEIIAKIPDYTEKIDQIIGFVDGLESLLGGENGLAEIKADLTDVLAFIGSAENSGDTLFGLLETIERGNASVLSAVTELKTTLTGTLADMQGDLTDALGALGTLTGALAEETGWVAQDIAAAKAEIDKIVAAIGSIGSGEGDDLVSQIGDIAASLEDVKGTVGSIAESVDASTTVETAKEEALTDIETWINDYLDNIIGTEEAVAVVRTLAYTEETTEGDIYAKLKQAFSEENAGLVLKYYNDALAAIDSATTVSEVTTAVSTLKAQVASVEAAAQNAGVTNLTGVYVLLAVVLVAVAAAIVIMLLKKNSQPAPAEAAAQPAAPAQTVNETAAEVPAQAEEDKVETDASVKDEETAKELAAADDDVEHVVIATNVRTFSEAYDELSEDLRDLFNKVRDYALTKTDAVEVKQSSGICVKRGSRQIVKLTIRRNAPMALFFLENEMLRDFRRDSNSGSKLKIRATELILREQADLDAAYKMVDLSVEGIEKDIEARKERKRELRRLRRQQRAQQKNENADN